MPTAPDLEANIHGTALLWEASRKSGLVDNEQKYAEEIHNYVQEIIKVAAHDPTSIDFQHIVNSLKLLEQKKFPLTEDENRYLLCTELVGGINSNWARQEVKERIGQRYGKGGIGQLKAFFAGAVENWQGDLKIKENYSSWDDFKRRIGKVVVKGGGVGAVGVVAVGIGALIGAPLTVGATAVATGGAAVARGAWELKRLFGTRKEEEKELKGKREWQIRNELNKGYLDRYKAVDESAQQILKWEQTLIKAPALGMTPDQINQLREQIKNEHVKLVELIRAQELNNLEGALRRVEVKEEAKADLAAFVGSVAPAGASILHGITTLHAGGNVALDLSDPDKVKHAVQLVKHWVDQGFQFFGTPTGPYLPPPSAIAPGWEVMREGWTQIMGGLAKRAVEYGIAGATVSGMEGIRALASNLAPKATAQEGPPQTGGPVTELSDRSKRLEKLTTESTPKPPEAEPSPDPELEPGTQYVFKKGKPIQGFAGIIAGVTTLGPLLAPDGRWAVETADIKKGLVQLKEKDPTGGTANTLTIKIETLKDQSIATRWEHVNYTMKEREVINRYNGRFNQLEQHHMLKFFGDPSGKVTPEIGSAPFDIKAKYIIDHVDKEANLITFIDDETGPPSAITYKISAILNWIRDVAPHPGPPTTEEKAEMDQEAERKKAEELEKLKRRVEHEVGKMPGDGDILYVKTDNTYTDSEGLSYKFEADTYYIVTGFDEKRREFELEDPSGKKLRMSINHLLTKKDDIQETETWLREEMAKQEVSGKIMPKDTRGRYAINAENVWVDPTVPADEYLVMHSKGRGPKNLQALSETAKYEVYLAKILDPATLRIDRRAVKRIPKTELIESWNFVR